MTGCSKRRERESRGVMCFFQGFAFERAHVHGPCHPMLMLEALTFVTGGKTRAAFDKLKGDLGFEGAANEEYHQCLGLSIISS